MDGANFSELDSLHESESTNKFGKLNNLDRDSKNTINKVININKRESVEFWDDIEEDRFISYPETKVERMSFKEMKNKNNFSKKPTIEDELDKDSKLNLHKQKIFSDKYLIHIKSNQKNSEFECINLDYDDFIGGKNNSIIKFENKNIQDNYEKRNNIEEDYFPTVTEQSFGISKNKKKIRNKSLDCTDFPYQKSSTLTCNNMTEKLSIPQKINPNTVSNSKKKKSDKLNNPNRSMIETTAKKLSVREQPGFITSRENNKIRNMSQDNKENKIKPVSKLPINLNIQKNAIYSQNSNPDIEVRKNVSQVPKKVYAGTSQLSNGTPNKQKLDHLNHLINKAKEKDEKIKFLRELSEQEKIIKELDGCTFKPKINTKFVPSNKMVINERNINTYERHLNWNNKKEEKLEKEKQYYKIQENMECTFTPEINRKPNLENTASKQIDNSTKNFYQRIHNAKKLKEEQESKLCPDYNERYQKIVKGKIPKLDHQGSTNSGSNINSNKSEESEHFGTFNPVPIQQNNNENFLQANENKVDFLALRKTLHARLHSLDMTNTKFV